MQIYRASDEALQALQDAVDIACIGWHPWLPQLAVYSLQTADVQPGVGYSQDSARKGGSWDLTVMRPAGHLLLLPKHGLPAGSSNWQAHCA